MGRSISLQNARSRSKRSRNLRLNPWPTPISAQKLSQSRGHRGCDGCSDDRISRKQEAEMPRSARSE